MREELKVSKGRILVVDDEQSMREFLSIFLERSGYTVELAEDGAEAIEFINNDLYDLVVTDLSMPKVGGLQVLAHVKEASPSTAVILVTAYASTESAVEAMKAGAFDYIIKPFKLDELKIVIQKALENQRLVRENALLRRELADKYGFGNLIGRSKAMREIYGLVAKVRDTRTNVLIYGESGTGKELVARSLHYSGVRKERPFVAVNCGAIPENLIESELFGHKKGAFTGAHTNKLGLFMAANGGTIFLDEIGEMPLTTQVKLLRVLQERKVKLVGSVENQDVDVRVIAATNKDLQEEIREGRFREDLYYRLNVVQLHIPALRARKDDLPLLAQHFLAKYATEYDRNIIGISDEAMRRLQQYDFPGNVRELENIIERAVALETKNQISLEGLPTQLRGPEAPEGLDDFLNIPEEGMDMDGFMGHIEQALLSRALERTAGMKKKAAKLLGITFRSFRYRLAKYDMDDQSSD